MRYIRFLKPPRIVNDRIHCLITLTSDLGDSFLPCPVTLSAELIHSQSSHPPHVVIWKTVQWTAGMRSLSVTLPLSTKSPRKWPILVRVGVEPKSEHDDLDSLHQDCYGVVSAWSADLDPTQGLYEAEKIVQRRFKDHGNPIYIFEETGESIARHLWDAGIAFACHLNHLLSRSLFFNHVSLNLERPNNLYILELGCGCGLVGIAFAQSIPGAQVLLTDLPEARNIAERNISRAACAKGASLRFQELNWEDALPTTLLYKDGASAQETDLVIASDCTYNSDSSPALVRTLRLLAERSPHVTVAIAMKRRHSSEDVFFDLMREASFQTKNSIALDLPRDEGDADEPVRLHTYKYVSKDTSGYP